MKDGAAVEEDPRETVVFTMNMPDGDEKTLFGQDETGALTGAMMSMGAALYARAAARRIHKAEGERRREWHGRVIPDHAAHNIVAAIALAAHVLRKPSFPAAEFEQAREADGHFHRGRSFRIQKRRPTKRVERQFNIYPKGDPRYASTMKETLDGIKAVTLDDVKRFHKTFYAANRAQFAVVAISAKPKSSQAIQEVSAAGATDTPWKRITRDYRDIPAKNISIETPDKENATLLARINLDVNQNDPDYAALQLAGLHPGRRRRLRLRGSRPVSA